jgi:predicted metal-dependent hydrolase
VEPPWDEARKLWLRGLYWEVHEVLEPAWIEAKGPKRHFIQGVIQLAAALHKAKTSKKGAERLLQKALGHLRQVPGLDAEAFAAGVRQALEEPSARPPFPLDALPGKP